MIARQKKNANFTLIGLHTRSFIIIFNLNSLYFKGAKNYSFNFVTVIEGVIARRQITNCSNE